MRSPISVSKAHALARPALLQGDRTRVRVAMPADPALGCEMSWVVRRNRKLCNALIVLFALALIGCGDIVTTTSTRYPSWVILGACARRGRFLLSYHLSSTSIRRLRPVFRLARAQRIDAVLKLREPAA